MAQINQQKTIPSCRVVAWAICRSGQEKRFVLSGEPADHPAAYRTNRLFGLRAVIFSEIHLENNGFYAKKSNASSKGAQMIFWVEELWKKKSPFV
jgi:hypothetical protein